MQDEISVVEVKGQYAAVIPSSIRLSDIAGQVMPMVDRVWEFIRGGGAESPGHNIWIYHYRGSPGEVDVEIGVQVAAPFPDGDEVACALTPQGRAAHAVHYGEYHDLPRVHQAIIDWCARNGFVGTGDNWEVYGDWEESPDKRRTDVYHLLKD